MRVLLHSFLFCCCLVPVAQAVNAQAPADEASRVLAEQGRFWQERGDQARAAEAWKKLLLVEPESAQALYGLATVELKEGRPAQARAYLERLRNVQPGSPLLALLEQDMRLHEGNNMAVLEEARLLAASQELDDALAKYRQALGDWRPVGDVGREYYGYLGYAEGGLQEAITGLRRLAAQSPGDPQVQLLLARHLARNESTRLDGIRHLASLSKRADIGSDAAESWRDALAWLGPPRPEAQPLFTAYLEAHPDDQEIRAQLEQGIVAAQKQVAEAARRKADEAKPAAPRPDPLRRRTDAAMKLLESGDTGRARAEFEAVLAQRPDQSEALGGLGIVAMRAGDWRQAHDYLSRARRGNAAWQASLDAVQYWVDVEDAQALLGAGNLDEARKRAQRAARQNPRELAAQRVLADVLAHEGHTAQAIAAYRALLDRQPGDVQLRSRLAQLHLHAGNEAEASRLLDDLLAADPDDPQALFASARLAAEQGQWRTAHDTLERIPAAKRTLAMSQLHEAARNQVDLAQAAELLQLGKKTEALALLGRVQSGLPVGNEGLGRIARMYLQLGETESAMALMGPLRAMAGKRSVDASIAYAQLLLASDQRIEAGVVLRHLSTRALTAAQQADVDSLWNAYQSLGVDASAGASTSNTSSGGGALSR